MRNVDFQMAVFMSPRAKSAGRPGLAGSVSHWLCLAAAPAFALMALWTALFGTSGMICSAMPDGFSMGGMTAMYFLMSVFHLPPWLKWIGGRG